MAGVVRTRVGYSGGTLKNPTYHNLGDHTETIEIDFDPAVISYEKMRGLFWTTHNPCSSSGSRQYMSAIFTRDATQKRLAEASMEREAARRGMKIKTAILPFTGFTLAEDYHQKYYLRSESGIVKELLAYYPTLVDFVNSTAATRANAWVGGHADPDAVKRELPSMGLSAASQKALLDRVR